MTITATKNSKTSERDLPQQASSSNIDSDRQYRDVAQVGQKAITAVADDHTKKSWFSRANDNLKSWFRKSNPLLDRESIASTSSCAHDKGSLSASEELSKSQPSDDDVTSSFAKMPNEKKRHLITHRLVFELFRDKTADYETQLHSKAHHQENQLQSQQRLQRALNNISDLPQTSLSKTQKHDALQLIQAVKADGVECDLKVWTRSSDKQNLEEEIRLAIDEKQSNHPILTNQYMQISQTKSEFTQMCLKLIQSPHDTILAAARAIGR